MNGRTKKVVAVRNRFSDVNTNLHCRLLWACQVEKLQTLAGRRGRIARSSDASEKDAMMPSPVCFTTCPPLSFNARRTSASCARTISTGSCIAKTLCHAGRTDDVGEHNGPQGRINCNLIGPAARLWIRHPSQEGLDSSAGSISDYIFGHVAVSFVMNPHRSLNIWCVNLRNSPPYRAIYQTNRLKSELRTALAIPSLFDEPPRYLQLLGLRDRVGPEISAPAWLHSFLEIGLD